MGDRTWIVRCALALGAFVLIAAPACESESASASDAVNLLSRMLDAEKTFAYEGIQSWTHAFGGKVHTYRHLVTHFADGPSEIRRESAGSRSRGRLGVGPGWPGQGARVMWRGRLHWMRDRDLLLQNYRVKEEGHQEVAERRGVVISFTSKYEGRPSMRLVLDEATGLLLSSDKLDFRGESRFRASFDTLLLSPELPERPERPAPGEWKGWPRRDEGRPRPELSFSPLFPAELPEGFVEKWRWRHRSRGGGESLRIIYTDGLTWIELDQSLADEGAEENVVRRRVRGSRTSMTVVVDGIEVRLEGEIEPGSLLSLLESLGTQP